MQPADVRAQNDGDAGKAEHQHGDPAAVHALTEKQRREHGHPHRHGEFDGEDGGERERADGVDPAILAADVHERARDVQGKEPRAQRRCPLAREHGEHD
jgi:hypothetical protein